jgi:WD40 repeat protein
VGCPAVRWQGLGALVLSVCLVACLGDPNPRSFPATASLSPTQESTPTVTLTPSPSVSLPLPGSPEPQLPTPTIVTSLTPLPTLTIAAGYPQVKILQDPANEFLALSPENTSHLEQLAEITFSPWDLVTAVAWSPLDETLAVTAGERLYLFRSGDWSLAASIRIGALSQDLAFSPDGSWLAAGGRDGLVRAWFQPLAPAHLVDESQPSVVLEAHRKGVNALAFSPNGLVLASGGNDAVARFWDLSTNPGEAGAGQVLGLMIGGTFAVPSIAFAPDGLSLAVANGRMVRLREVGSERILGSFQAENPLVSLAYSHAGSWLAAGDNLNQVLIWDPTQAFRTGNEHYPEPVRLVGHDGSPGTYRALIWELAFSSGDLLLASAGGDGTLRIWDVAGGSLLATLTGHTKGVACLAFDRQGALLASGGLDGVVKIWGVAAR